VKWIGRINQGESFQDRSRSGRPAIFTELIQLKITAFFCQSRPLPGCHSITLKWAASYFNRNLSFLGCIISISSISRILRKHSLKPHLHKYFLQVTDPNLFDILPLIVNLYLNPPEYLFCFDECPGIQALRKVAPPLPAGQGKKGGKYSEPNHNRMGTTDLYAFLHVNTGKIFARCRENHRVETLIEVFKEHVASLPATATIHYICDNLSNHSCPEFCRIVAQLSNVDYPEKELDTKEKRQKWLGIENKRIIIHFTPKHGSWLNMVEIWFGIMAQKCLKYNSFKSVDALIDFIYDFVQTWEKYFAHPFKWTYDGTGLHSQAVRRLITHIAIENEHMEISFLVGQMELMINLLQRYFDYVRIKDWQLLAKTIEDKKNFIGDIVRKSDKPRIKEKAEKTFPILLDLLKTKLESRLMKVS
jgi:transposase